MLSPFLLTEGAFVSRAVSPPHPTTIHVSFNAWIFLNFCLRSTSIHVESVQQITPTAAPRQQPPPRHRCRSRNSTRPIPISIPEGWASWTAPILLPHLFRRPNIAATITSLTAMKDTRKAEMESCVTQSLANPPAVTAAVAMAIFASAVAASTAQMPRAAPISSWTCWEAFPLPASLLPPFLPRRSTTGATRSPIDSRAFLPGEDAASESVTTVLTAARPHVNHQRMTGCSSWEIVSRGE